MADRFIRQSEIRTFKRCRRKWMLQYVRNLERRPFFEDEPTITRTGTAVHAMLEEHYRLGEGYTPSDDTLANTIVEGYFDWVEETGADAGLRVVSVEKRLVVWLGEFSGFDVYLTGQLDLVVYDENTGLYLIVDHKTVQSLDQFGEQLKVDDQLLTYAWLMRQEGFRIDGALHNMLRRVKRTPRATPPFYGRRIVRFNDEQMRNHEEHLKATVMEMAAYAKALEDGVSHHSLAYPNPTKDCTWDCPYLPVCPMMDDGSNWELLLEAEYQVRKELPA